MRAWEAVLRRDTKAWDDFKAWLTEMATLELDGLMHVGTSEQMYHQKGKVVGIRSVLTAATANEREETQRARTS